MARPAQRYASAQELLERPAPRTPGLRVFRTLAGRCRIAFNPLRGEGRGPGRGSYSSAALLSAAVYRHLKSGRRLNLIGSSTPVELAVLPFTPMSDDRSKAFGNGLTETLTAKLSR